MRDYVKKLGAAITTTALARQRLHNLRTLVPNARQARLKRLLVVGSTQLTLTD